jgi:hypothetical protein
MALSHVELYEALKDWIGEKAAALIADVVPPARELATKLDVAELGRQIAELRTELTAEIEAGFAQLRTLRWMLGLFLPMWFGTWVTLVALVLKN